jgi:hypothetical protein
MKTVGKIKSTSRELDSGNYNITFSITELPMFDGTTYDLWDIEWKVHRDKRSLDANAYAWMLMSRIADVLKMTKDEVYVEELKRYGQLAFQMKVPHGTDVNPAGLYVKFIEYDGENDIYMVFRGSSTYDTKEMSTFIDGIVQDAKELNIDTVPRVELEKIKKKWRL